MSARQVDSVSQRESERHNSANGAWDYGQGKGILLSSQVQGGVNDDDQTGDRGRRGLKLKTGEGAREEKGGTGDGGACRSLPKPSN